MRKNEIEVGKDYAYEPYSGYARRVRVLEFGANRTVFRGSRDYRGSTVNDGILVQYVKDDGTLQTRKQTRTSEVLESVGGIPMLVDSEVEFEVPSTEVVISRKIVRTWDAEISAQAVREVRKVNVAKHNEDYKSGVETLANLLAAVGACKAYQVSGDGTRGTREWMYNGVKLPLSALKVINVALAEFAAENEVAS